MKERGLPIRESQRVRHARRGRRCAEIISYRQLWMARTVVDNALSNPQLWMPMMAPTSCRAHIADEATRAECPTPDTPRRMRRAEQRARLPAHNRRSARRTATRLLLSAPLRPAPRRSTARRPALATCRLAIRPPPGAPPALQATRRAAHPLGASAPDASAPQSSVAGPPSPPQRNSSSRRLCARRLVAALLRRRSSWPAAHPLNIPMPRTSTLRSSLNSSPRRLASQRRLRPLFIESCLAPRHAINELFFAPRASSLF